MRVLVVGSGGREHALVHALARSPSVDQLFAAPGNPGMSELAELLPIANADLAGLARAAVDRSIDLTVVGPEVPLAAGIGDEFAERGLRLFGPTSAAARLEASKVFAKEFCLRHGVPTARAEIVTTAADARAAVGRLGLPVVLKADGLAAGKGVLIADSDQAVAESLEMLFVERRFGAAADRVLVEECLVGTEVSYMVISDGVRVEPFATSHDYKRVGEGDRGPNTGGMGSHSPAYALSGAERREILDDIILPTIRGMASEGRDYRGILYAGLMVTADGPKVLEFNCRLGDPETQSVLRRLEGDLGEVFTAAADGRLEPGCISWRDEAAACVVLAAENYPASPRTGDEIAGIADARALPGVEIYHAGTRLDGDRLVTAGGRVLSVTATGSTLDQALDLSYRAARYVRFEGVHFRSDLGADTLTTMEG
jgi:phosphoribosylamine--glycine ligase